MWKHGFYGNSNTEKKAGLKNHPEHVYVYYITRKIMDGFKRQNFTSVQLL